ncbi:MAG: CheR family methyltransferase, partial [Spirulinaceae cyanobacterium]
MVVVLSGTGSDGTQGLRDIHEAGGITLVQEPSTAEFDGMPRSAIATGVINRILSPRDLAETIYQFLQSPQDSQELSQQQALSSNSPELQNITSLLARYKQVDFSHYKSNTLSRRIHRRCLITGCTSIEEYIELLEISAEEREILRGDLLIGVTNFFRDRPAWNFLEKNVIHNLLKQAESGQELRFWITACSTGEEAYSLAILVDEAIAKFNKRVKVKIFATDINRLALEKAAQGVYPENIANEINQERLAKYFTATEVGFQVSRKLREMLIFAPHDLTKDAGFTRIHLISCRNVLIYMQPQLQQQVLRNLHFALTVKGTLFLGESETLGDFNDEFLTLHKTWKLYQKKRDVRLNLPLRGVEKLGTNMVNPPSEKKISTSRREPVLEAALNLVLGQQKSTCLLVNNDNQVLYLFEDLANVLKLPTGELSRDVNKLVISALKLPLNTALHRAKKEKKPILYTGIKLDQEDDSRRVNLKVSRNKTNKLAGDFLMVTITENNQSPPSKLVGESFEADAETAQRITELEEELQHTRENLQAVIEELETTNEEQQATN